MSPSLPQLQADARESAPWFFRRSARRERPAGERARGLGGERERFVAARRLLALVYEATADDARFVGAEAMACRHDLRRAAVALPNEILSGGEGAGLSSWLCRLRTSLAEAKAQGWLGSEAESEIAEHLQALSATAGARSSAAPASPKPPIA